MAGWNKEAIAPSMLHYKTKNLIVQTEGRQKAIESYRISPEQKEYLRTLKMK